MSKLRIGLVPNPEFYGPEVAKLYDVLGDCRVESTDVLAEQKALVLDNGKTADALDQKLADDAYREGRPAPGRPNREAYEAKVIENGARLRAAIAAEATADAALFVALAENYGQAVEPADAALDQAADDIRKAVEVIKTARARLHRAENARRYIDGVAEAAAYKGDQRWDAVFPVAAAQRPPKRNGQYLMPMRVKVEDIDRGLAAILEEVEICQLRPDTAPVQALPDTPASELSFDDRPKRRRGATVAIRR